MLSNQLDHLAAMERADIPLPELIAVVRAAKNDIEDCQKCGPFGMHNASSCPAHHESWAALAALADVLPVAGEVAK